MSDVKLTTGLDGVAIIDCNEPEQANPEEVFGFSDEQKTGLMKMPFKMSPDETVKQISLCDQALAMAAKDVEDGVFMDQEDLDVIRSLVGVRTTLHAVLLKAGYDHLVEALPALPFPDMDSANILTMPDPERTCPRCGITQSLYNFSIDRRNKNGRTTYCKTCHHDMYAAKKDRNK